MKKCVRSRYNPWLYQAWEILYLSGALSKKNLHYAGCRYKLSYNSVIIYGGDMSYDSEIKYTVDQVWAIIKNFYSYVGAGAVGLFFKIAYDELKLNITYKRKIRKEIIDLCAEGRRVRYKEAPENDKAIWELLAYLESKQSVMLKPLREYCDLWNITQFMDKRANSQKEKEYVLSLVVETEKHCKILLRAVEEW